MTYATVELRREWLEPLMFEPYQTQTWNSQPYIADESDQYKETAIEEADATAWDSALDRYNELREGLGALRSDEGYEQFFFSYIKQFILSYGETALRLLHWYFANNSAPEPAKYYFACLLGHIDDSATETLRLQFISEYKQSEDSGLREGAEESAEFLELV